MSDPVRGKLIASLLGEYILNLMLAIFFLYYLPKYFVAVGPCALDYTKMKTQDHYWSDPPAVELLQRHKLHNR